MILNEFIPKFLRLTISFSRHSSINNVKCKPQITSIQFSTAQFFSWYSFIFSLVTNSIMSCFVKTFKNIQRNSLGCLLIVKARSNFFNLKTGVLRKQNTPDFPENEHFLLRDTHTHFSDSPFCLITDHIEFSSSQIAFIQIPWVNQALNLISRDLEIVLLNSLNMRTLVIR